MLALRPYDLNYLNNDINSYPDQSKFSLPVGPIVEGQGGVFDYNMAVRAPYSPYNIPEIAPDEPVNRDRRSLVMANHLDIMTMPPAAAAEFVDEDTPFKRSLTAMINTWNRHADIEFEDPRELDNVLVNQEGKVFKLFNVLMTYTDLTDIIPEGISIARTMDAFRDKYATARRGARREPRAPDNIKNVFRIATAIYFHLFINRRRGHAMFYVSLGLEDSPLYVWGKEPMGNSIFIIVYLSNDLPVQRTEISYIALRLAEQTSEIIDFYKEVEVIPEGSTVLDQLLIAQPLYNDHVDFTHVIKSGPRNIDPSEYIRDLGSNSQDPGMASAFRRLYAYLDRNGVRLTSGGTYTNCVPKAIILARKDIAWEDIDIKHRRSVTSQAARLMRRMLPTRAARKEGRSLEWYAEWLEQNKRTALKPGEGVVFFNYLLEPIYRAGFHGIGAKILYIYIFAGHAMAIVSAKPDRLSRARPRMLIKELNPELLKTETEGGAIAADIETTADTVEPYAICVRIKQEDHLFFGIGCVLPFMEWCFNNIESGSRIWFHNGGKFDTMLIVKAIHKVARYKFVRICDRAGSILLLGIIDTKKHVATKSTTGRIIKRQYILYLVDSLPLLGMSLRQAAKVYLGEDGERKLDMDHEKFTVDRYEHEWIKQDGERYLKMDCIVLKKCLDVFNTITNTDLGFFPLENVLTPAGIARTVFRWYSYNSEDYPLMHLSQEVDHFFRRGYYGGHVALGFRGEWINSEREGTTIALDRNSMYPAELSGEMPYGYPEWRDFTELPDDFNGAVLVDVRGGRETGFNPLRYKSERGLVSPVFDTFTRCVYYSDMIRYASDPKFCYEFKIHGGYYVKTAKFLKQLVARLYRIKLDIAARFGDKSPRYKAIKVVINSLYGFFAMTLRSRKLEILTNPFKAAVYLATGNLHATVGNVALVTSATDTSVRYVPIAMACTCKAYLNLCKVIMAVEDNNYQFIYCDTDSIKTNAPIEILPLKIGKNLGEWLPEFPSGFDIVAVAPKCYAMRHASGQRAVKCKGFPKGPYGVEYEESGNICFEDRNKPGHDLKYGHIRKLLSGYKIKATMTQFRGGSGRWMRGMDVLIKKHTLSISGRMRKQIVMPNGSLFPFHVNNGYLLE